jgi:hypothetical protein
MRTGVTMNRILLFPLALIVLTVSGSYNGDVDFDMFLDYLENRQAPREYIELVTEKSQNPSYRGRIVPGFNRSNAGIQFANITNLTDGKKASVGGMQYYFTCNKEDYTVSGHTIYEIMREYDPVPVVLVEIDNSTGQATDGILRGKRLVEEARSDLERYYIKKFDIKFRRISLDYELFVPKLGITPGAYISMTLDKHIHNIHDDEAIYIYYFTDKKRWSRIDRKLSHPVKRGVFTSDWSGMVPATMHELGHAIGLRHHFPSPNCDYSGQDHISGPCVMNYRFNTDSICYLCRYALGIGTDTPPFKQDTIPVLMSEYRVNGNTMESVLIDYETDRIEYSYDFNKLQLQQIEPWNDLLITRYRNNSGESYIGLFNSSLQFQSEYNFGDLELVEYKTWDERLLVHYRNSEGIDYLGIFDKKMQFVAEYNFDTLKTGSWFPYDNKVVVQYTAQTGEQYVGAFNENMEFIQESYIGRGTINRILYGAYIVVQYTTPDGHQFIRNLDKEMKTLGEYNFRTITLERVFLKNENLFISYRLKSGKGINRLFTSDFQMVRGR